MANDSSNTAPDRQIIWLAVAAMLCLLVLAVAGLSMAFFLSRSQPPSITLNNGSNNQAEPVSAQAAAGTPAGGALLRPSNPGFNGGHRQDLPITSDAESPAFYPSINQFSKVHFRVRVQPVGPEHMSGPMPFHVRNYQPAADGQVADVVASQPQAGQEQDYSYLPDVAFKPSEGKMQGLSVEVLHPHKSSVVNGLRAPKGFQFLVAELLVKNSRKAEISLDPDGFEVRDNEDMRYLANPELLSSTFPQQPMAAGAKASFEIAFLVPADAALTALATLEPGGPALLCPLKSL